jgi:FkbM family methyltransferase
MKSFLKRIINKLLKFPISIKLIKFIEEISQNYQGKGNGWGVGSIENEVKNCLSLLKISPKNFIDIGANKGEYTNYLLRVKPNLECHIFEPSVKNFEKLKNRFSQQNIFINKIGLSSSNKKSKLYSDYSGSGLASLTKRRLEHFQVDMSFEEIIELQRFDNYWEDKNSILDYIKIDVEGHELDVLEGFGDLIQKVRLIQFEFGGCNIDTRTFFQDYWYYFTEKEFLIFRITPRGPLLIKNYSEKDESFLTTNYIALNTKL